MIRSSSFIPYSTGFAPKKDAKGVADILRAHDKLASILPTVTRMIALQKDCATALPSLFENCQVLNLEDGELTIAIPNAAFASKLKQRTPKLQENLLKRGWQVSAIRLKVQVMQNHEKKTISRSASLSNSAASAFSDLNNNLDNSPRNAALRAALQAMLEKHRGAR